MPGAVEDYREQICERQHNRIQSACQQAAASSPNLAKRRGVAEVRYDDHDHSYVAVFPWFELRRLVERKLDALQVELVPADRDANVPRGGCSTLSESTLAEASGDGDRQADSRNAG